jgi:pimeloyl-ACP methyl ester carboxylesterase
MPMRWFSWLPLIFQILLMMVLVGIIALVGWTRRVFPADETAHAGLDSTELVSVARTSWITFTPRGIDPNVGVVFYPGGKAQPEAYAPILRALAERGFLVVLAPMPLNLALLGRERAAEILPKYPLVDRWIIAGHSLGGAIACQFAARHRDRIAGLLLWAAFPGVETDLSQSSLPVLSIAGSNDDLTTAAKLADSRSRLPAHAYSVTIDHADHWTFGNFAGLSNDRPEERELRQFEILNRTTEFLEQIDMSTEGASL